VAVVIEKGDVRVGKGVKTTAVSFVVYCTVEEKCSRWVDLG